MVSVNWFSLVLAVAGLLAYFVSSNPKVSRVGEIAFAVGLFVFTWHLGTAVIRIGS